MSLLSDAENYVMFIGTAMLSISADDHKKRENVDGLESRNTNKKRRLSDSSTSIGSNGDDIMYCLPVEDQDNIMYSLDGSEIAMSHFLIESAM